MPMFTKKTVTVEAVQWFIAGDHPAVLSRTIGDETEIPHVIGKQGPVRVDPGDWIIAEIDGSGFYPCKDSVFQATYAPAQVLDVAAMSFGDALVALKAGKRVARAGWNGKNMWLSISGPARGLEVTADRFWSENNAEHARQSGGSAIVLPSITMKTATGEILMGWLASQTDMLAEDWLVVQPVEAPSPVTHQDTRSRGEPRVPRFDPPAA